jgi:hypothetical protein
MKRSESIAALAEAFAAAQAEYVPVKKTKTASVKGTSKNGKDYDYTYKYADLADILEMVIPCLSKQGLAFSQPHCMVDGKLRVVSYLLHKSGEWMHSDGIEISELSPDPKQLGIESTYFRRYDGSSFLGIAPDEDTDGQSTGDRTRRTEENQSKPLTLCPVCGKYAIIKGKEEYGGGWLCYKAKGGCGAKFTVDPATVNQNSSADPDLPSEVQTSHQPAAAQPQGGALRFIPPNGLTAVIKDVKEIEGVAAKPAVGDIPATKGVRPRLIVTFLGQHNGVSETSCFDTKLWPALKESVGLECHFQIAEKDSGGKHYINIEDIVYVAGEEFKDGKPYVIGEK